MNRIGIGTGAAKNLSVDLLHAAYDLGMSVVDTSPRCGSEEIVGKSLVGRRDKVFVITKVSPEDMEAHDVVASCERSMKTMGVDYIDLLTTHWPNPEVSFHSTAQGLCKLKDRGKILNIGVGNVSLDQLMAYRYILPAITAVQNEYNLFERSVEVDMLPYCVDKGIKFFAYSPLDGGNFCGGPKKSDFLRNDLAATFGVPPAALCLSYLLNQHNVHVLPRISSKARLEETMMSNSVLSGALYEIRSVLAGNGDAFKPVKIKPSEIDLRLSPYKTIEDAMSNVLGRCPSPEVMASGYISLKPLKVRREGTTYVLVEGFMRYWAHVITLDNDPIDVLVRE